MKVRNLLLASLAVAAMTACSNENDETVDNGQVQGTENAVIRLGISYPTVTRANTEDGLTEEQIFRTAKVIVNGDVHTYVYDDFEPSTSENALYLKKGIPVAAGVFYSIFGWLLDPMYGAAAMSLSSVFVVSNALRLRFFKPKHQIIKIQENRKKEEKKMKKVLVEGMMCEHCKAHVEKALNAIDGIQATVDLEKNCAFVEGEANEATLKQAIEEAGYTYKGIE